MGQQKSRSWSCWRKGWWRRRRRACLTFLVTMDYMKGPLSQTAMVHAPGEAKPKIFELQGTLDFPVDGPTEEPVMVMLEEGVVAAAAAGMSDVPRHYGLHEGTPIPNCHGPRAW